MVASDTSQDESLQDVHASAVDACNESACRARDRTHKTYHLGHERSRYFRLDWTDNRLATTGRDKVLRLLELPPKCSGQDACFFRGVPGTPVATTIGISIPCRGGSQEALSVSSVELAEEQSSYVQVG